MESRKVVVIGGGMAGLCTGIYLQMSGFETTIFEAHSLPGGLCTSWKRGRYTFDGCVHWLMGSGPGSPFHRLWREVIDLDQVRFVDPDHLFVQELANAGPDGSHLFHLYADIDRQAAYMKGLSPEDAGRIDEVLHAARSLQGRQLPPLLERAPEVRTLREKLSLLKLLPVMPTLLRWARTSNKVFASRLKSPFLREAFEQLYGEYEIGLFAMLMQLSVFDARCAGYPLGGSLSFARRFAERFEALGGTIRYRQPVREILVESGQAAGVRLADGSEHRADVVISAADGRWTLFEALGGRFLDDRWRALYRGEQYELYPSMLLVSLGLRRRLEQPAHLVRYRMDPPLVLPDGSEHRRLALHSYAADPMLAPEGCTMANLLLETRAFDYWQRLRSGDPTAYREAKRKVADAVIGALDARLPGLREDVEEVDVATPATVGRYTHNWQGSYEGWLPPREFKGDTSLPKELPGLDRFFMVGQWVEPGGGLPPALMHGRQITQVICHRFGVPFRVVPATAGEPTARS